MTEFVKRVAFYANESFFDRDSQTYQVVKINEDEAGYEAVAGHRELAKAIEVADQCNEVNGLSRDDVLEVVASSMRQGPVLR